MDLASGGPPAAVAVGPQTSRLSDLHRQRRVALSTDHEHALRAARYLAWALASMGRYADARDLYQETLDRYRRTLGPDHSRTLVAADNLAGDLRDLGGTQT